MSRSGLFNIALWTSCLTSKAHLGTSLSPSERLCSLYRIEVHRPHPRTEETAIRHCEDLELFLGHETIAAHTQAAFSQAQAFVDAFYSVRSPSRKLVVLDSGCGTGKSTLTLAARHPGLPVIGIDRSFVRLSRNAKFRHEMDGSEGEPSLPNLIFVRADLIDFFLLALHQRDWVIHSHYLLYPNPYPKSKHLKRRLHGHPILPVMLALGGQLILRSNWFVYLQEFEMALNAINRKYLTGSEFEFNCLAMPLISRFPMTNFERKYSLAELPLYELQADMGIRDHSGRMSFLSSLTIDR